MRCGHDKLLTMAEFPLGACLQKALSNGQIPSQALFTKSFLSFPIAFFLLFCTQLKSLVLEGGRQDMEISLSFSRINFLKVFYRHSSEPVIIFFTRCCDAYRSNFGCKSEFGDRGEKEAKCFICV